MDMNILLDPRNKPAEEFFIFLKIQDGRRRSKKICPSLGANVTNEARYTFSMFSWNPTFNIFSSHWKVGSSMNCFFTGGGGGGGGRVFAPPHIFCNNLDPAHRIQTKFGMDILLDPWNKPAKEFFIFIKIQDRRLRSNVQNRQNLTLQITFRLSI